MVSQTITKIMELHQANTDLISSTPAQMMNNQKDLSADEAMASLDEQIIANTVQALEAGNTHYVDVPGIGPLRDAVANYLNQQFGSQYITGNMIVTAGVQESRFLTIQKISEEFTGHIAVPAVVHPGVLKAIGIRPREVTKMAVELSQSVLPAVESVREAVTSGTRLLYLESPSRLTGEAYSKEAVAEIAGITREHDATMIWDQGLEPWVDGYASLLGQDGIASNVVGIGEAFPGAGLASWFIGYIAAPEQLVPAMQSQKQIMAICTSTPTQFAALEASKLFVENHARQVKQLKDAKRTLVEKAQQAGTTVLDGAAVNILAVQASSEAVERLNSAGFQAALGADFGADGVIRLNVAQSSAQAVEALS